MFDQALGMLWPVSASVSSCTLLPAHLAYFFSIIGLFCCVSTSNQFFLIKHDGIFLCNTVLIDC
jgi:hypothetical protein